MEDDPTIASKKRSLQYINSSEMTWKFKSKQDLYVYLDEHSKFLLLQFLTLLQNSSTFHRRSSSPRTSSRRSSSKKSSC